MSYYPRNEERRRSIYSHLGHAGTPAPSYERSYRSVSREPSVAPYVPRSTSAITSNMLRRRLSSIDRDAAIVKKIQNIKNKNILKLV